MIEHQLNETNLDSESCENVEDQHGNSETKHSVDQVTAEVHLIPVFGFVELLGKIFRVC